MTWLPTEVELVDVDLRELALPLLDEPEMPSDGNYAHEHTRRWAALVESLDAVVLVMPEYNRGYNAALKNAIDYLYAEWDGMPVACVGYGWSGAQYARSALRQTLERIKMVVVEGAALSFEKTLDLDGTVHADAALRRRRRAGDVRRAASGRPPGPPPAARAGRR